MRVRSMNMCVWADSQTCHLMSLKIIIGSGSQRSTRHDVMLACGDKVRQNIRCMYNEFWQSLYNNN